MSDHKIFLSFDQAKKIKRRAIELFHKDSPYKIKIVKSKKVYKRKPKHRDKEQ